jgi:hypothetical protein
MQMPRAKAIVRTVPAWGDRKVAGGTAGRAPPVRLVHSTDQTGAGQDRQRFGFHACMDAWFSSGGRGSGGWHGKFAGDQFTRRSPRRAQYEGGRSRSFEMERRNGPRSPFRGFRSPPARQGWFPWWFSWW